MTRNGRVDLRFETKLTTPVEYVQRAVERARDTTKAIVGRRVFAIQAQREANQTGIGKALHCVSGNQRRRRWRHCHTEPFPARISDDVENVGAFSWIAAG